MSLRVRAVTVSILFVMSSLSTACHHDAQDVSRGQVVGTYEYKADAPTRVAGHHLGERLVLRDDGEYELWPSQPNASRPTISGRWVFRDGDPATVYLDHSGYPIELQPGVVRLVVNDDVNARYEKTR
jgi:hypothetical protein